ncbi:zinc ribbon domain-containing protein [Acinetobacter baumannii]
MNTVFTQQDRVFCPRCGADAGGDDKFCGDCGSPLPVTCRGCGSKNLPGKPFCT